MEDIKPVRYKLRNTSLRTRGPIRSEYDEHVDWSQTLGEPRKIDFEVGKFIELKYKVVYDPVDNPSDSNMSTVAIHRDGTVEFLVDKKSWYQQMLDFVRNVF